VLQLWRHLMVCTASTHTPHAHECVASQEQLLEERAIASACRGDAAKAARAKGAAGAARAAEAREEALVAEFNEAVAELEEQLAAAKAEHQVKGLKRARDKNALLFHGVASRVSLFYNSTFLRARAFYSCRAVWSLSLYVYPRQAATSSLIVDFTDKAEGLEGRLSDAQVALAATKAEVAAAKEESAQVALMCII